MLFLDAVKGPVGCNSKGGGIMVGARLGGKVVKFLTTAEGQICCLLTNKWPLHLPALQQPSRQRHASTSISFNAFNTDAT